MSDIRPREGKILELLYHFPYMTDKQIVNLLDAKGIYKRGSATLVSTKLLNFITNRYLLRDTPLGDIQGGSVPFVYWLATIGRNYLADELGYDFSDWDRKPSEMAPFVKSTHLAHCLGVNDFLITASQIPQRYPQVQIATILHDFTLKRSMQGSPPIPDGLIKFLSGEQPVLWFEFDRKSEKETEFRSKIRKIVTFMENGFEDWFETPLDNFTWAFATPFGEERVDDMMVWTRKELIEMRRKHRGSVFLFAALPPDYDTSVFFNPVWSVPFDNKKSSIVEL